jgi:hypothetical protein
LFEEQFVGFVLWKFVVATARQEFVANFQRSVKMLEIRRDNGTVPSVKSLGMFAVTLVERLCDQGLFPIIVGGAWQAS